MLQACHIMQNTLSPTSKVSKVCHSLSMVSKSKVSSETQGNLLIACSVKSKGKFHTSIIQYTEYTSFQTEGMGHREEIVDWSKTKTKQGTLQILYFCVWFQRAERLYPFQPYWLQHTPLSWAGSTPCMQFFLADFPPPWHRLHPRVSDAIQASFYSFKQWPLRASVQGLSCNSLGLSCPP